MRDGRQQDLSRPRGREVRTGAASNHADMGNNLFLIGSRPKRGESRRDYLARAARLRFTGSVPSSVYQELVDLHDRMAALERAVSELRAQQR